MAVPSVSLISPVSILNVVVLPAPLTPSRPKHSPLGMLKLIRSTASLLWFTKQQQTVDLQFLYS